MSAALDVDVASAEVTVIFLVSGHAPAVTATRRGSDAAGRTARRRARGALHTPFRAG